MRNYRLRKILSLVTLMLMCFTIIPSDLVYIQAAENSKTNPIEFSEGDKTNFPQSPDEGYVLLDKKAEWVDGENGVAKITMSLQGKGVKKTTDVALVIDRSGSMGDKLDTSKVYDREVPLTFYASNVNYQSHYVHITGQNASISMIAYVDSNNIFRGYKKGTLYTTGLYSDSNYSGNPQFWDPMLTIFRGKTAQATIAGKNISVVFPTERAVLKNTKKGYSYNNSTKIESAKQAASSFVSTLLATEEMRGLNRIAVVSYSSDYSYYGETSNLVDVNSNLTNNADNLKNSISKITALGGTNIQAGIMKAQEILETSTAYNKYIVVMSDGEPTYSFKAVGAAKATSSDYNLNFPEYYDYKLTTFNKATIKGSGSSYVLDDSIFSYGFGGYYVSSGYDSIWVDNNGYPTISQALIAKKSGIEIYSVGFDVEGNDSAEDTMRYVASSDDNFYLTSDDLSGVYDDIAGKILIAGTNAEVSCPNNTSDNLGYYFEVLKDSKYPMNVSQGIATVSGDKKSISWDLGSNGTGGNITETPAVLQYYIKLNVTDSSKVHDGTLLETGGIASVVYKNYLGTWCMKKFPSAPLTAKSNVIIAKYFLSDENGNPINDKGVIVDYEDRNYIAEQKSFSIPLGTSEIKASDYVEEIQWYVNQSKGQAYDEDGNLLANNIAINKGTTYLNFPYQIDIVDYFLKNSMYQRNVVQSVASSSTDGSYKISNMVDYTFGFEFIAQKNNPDIGMTFSGLGTTILSNYKLSDFKLYDKESNLISRANTLEALDKTKILYHNTYTITYNLRYDGMVEYDEFKIKLEGKNFIPKNEKVKNPLVIINTGNMPGLE